MKKIIFSLVLFLLLSELNCVYHKISNYSDAENIYKIAVQGNRAYLLDEEQDLVILDISVPSTPFFIGSHDINDPRDLAISGRILCVSTDDNILIFDIGNPQFPTILSSISFEDNWGKIKIHDDILYVKKDLDEMYMFDIQYPETPIFLNSFDFASHIYDFAIENDIVFITDYFQQYIKIVDVSEPTVPILLSEYETRGDALGIFACDDLVYFCDGASGLVLMNVQSPQSPQIINNYPLLRDFKKLIVRNNIVFALNKYLGVFTIDFSDHSNPRLLSDFDSFYNTLDFALLEDHFFLADEEAGMQIIDISEPENFNMLRKFPLESQVIRIKNDFLVNSGGGLQVFDFSDPYEPDLLGINYYAFQKNFVIRENNIFGAHFSNYGNSSLQIIDITIPTNPTIAATCELSQTVNDIVIYGDKAYLSAAQEGIHIVDISDPEEPIWESTYNTPDRAKKVAYCEDKLYVADGFSGVRILDVSVPTNPTALGSYNQLSSAVSIAVKDTIAAILEKNSEIHLVNVSDPQSTNKLSTIFPHSDSNLNSEMKIIENHLIIQDKAWNELLIYDISVPQFPECVLSYRWNQRADTFDLDGEYLVSGNQHNFMVHRLDIPTTADDQVIKPNTDQLCNYPNPFNPSTTISFFLTTKSTENTEIIIYNLKGQKVRTLECTDFVDTASSQMMRSTTWNGRNENGKLVRSGIYFYHLKGNGKTIASKKMMLLK